MRFGFVSGLAAIAGAVLAAALLLPTPAIADPDDNSGFIRAFQHLDRVSFTVPSNGDQNPYGVAVVPVTQGTLVKDDILVSNFNNSSNFQGTGTTIVEISPTTGNLQVFATITQASLPSPCPGGIGLTTALVALRSGFVVVGSLPTTDGKPDTIGPGCLIVLDSSGKPRLTLKGNGINGPWDMTAVDLDAFAVLFVTNVLNGPVVQAKGGVVKEGTVLRILLATPPGGKPVQIASMVIGSGFPERTDPNALVIGPTGLGFGPDGRLYVADTLASRIAAIPNALFRLDDGGTGVTVSNDHALNQPLGLAIAPNGNILTVNAGDGNIVETEPEGEQIAVKNIDVSGQGGGTLFGLAIAPGGNGVYFVDDGDNSLDILR